MTFRFGKTAKDTDKKTDEKIDKKKKVNPKNEVRALRPVIPTRDPQPEDNTQSV